jgi:hypothetical protein
VPAQPSSAGYSGTPLPKKLGITADSVTAIIGAPPAFEATLGDLPSGARVSHSRRGQRDLTLWFVRSAAELRRAIPAMVAASRSGGVWIAWPKKASGVATDLTEDVVRKEGLAAGLVDHKVCAIDATWSGLRFALRKETR